MKIKLEKKLKFFVLSLAFVFVGINFTSCGYNGLVEKREACVSQWANVESQYQRRSDLVPNLVATVKGYASHEQSVYSDIASSREKLGSTTINLSAEDITNDEEKLSAYQAAQSELSSNLSRLLAITENYPELKANENFMDLQSQLEGIENRIATERKRYNDAVQDYNQSIQKFPALITAKMFNFTPKAYFKAESSAMSAPKVEF